MDWPKISIVTCTYNGERVIEEYFSCIFNQDYPLEKVELIIADGGSKDGTLDVIDKYKMLYPDVVRFMVNEKQYSIGKGFGMDNATRKAKGEIIIQLDQDNLLIQKNWLKKMVEILIENSDIAAVQSRYSANGNSFLIDRYINDLGIEDPFAINYSLNAQISLNPGKFFYDRKGGFYVYEVNHERFYYAGDNGFAIRKNKFFEVEGYTQDIDNFYRMAESKESFKIAVPKDVRLYHKTSTSLKSMLSKRIYYAGHYILKNIEERDFYWFSLKKNTFKQNLRFVSSVLYNLLFFPCFLKGLVKSIEERRVSWLVHGFVVWLMTAGYIYSFFSLLFFGKQKESPI